MNADLLSGIALFPSILSEPLLSAFKQQIDVEYVQIDAVRQKPERVAEKRFAPTASSFNVQAVLAMSSLRSLCAAVAPTLKAWIANGLSAQVACDLDRSWIRRQYSPNRYPPLHAPHGWHQDGALGFAFSSYPDGGYPSDALLSMVTCWIALDACGVEAPGLELMTERLTELLPPSELADDRVRRRFSADHVWRPAMQAGDALLFQGDVLHRTHVTPAMMRDRTSIELRFFAAENIPTRLKEDRFLTME